MPGFLQQIMDNKQKQLNKNYTTASKSSVHKNQVN